MLGFQKDYSVVDWLVDFNFGMEFELNLSARMQHVVEVLYPDLQSWVQIRCGRLRVQQIKRLAAHATKTDDWLLELLCLWFLANRGQEHHQTALITFLQSAQPPFDGAEYDELQDRLIAPLIAFWCEVRQMQRNRRSISRRASTTK